MNFSEYLSNHPDRLRSLDSTKEFFETCGLDPVYVDSDRRFIDILTLSAFIALHGGTKLRDEMKIMETYLKSKALRHPEDTPEAFGEALQELKKAYKTSRKKYPERANPDNALPFFVHPETAFGFMRRHMVSSEETYGMQLEPAASIIPLHARDLILAALNDWKEKNYLAWYLAVENISMKLQTRRTETPEGAVEHALEVYVYIPRSQPKHARLELKTDAEGRPKIPPLRKLIKRVHEAVVLPGFDYE